MHNLKICAAVLLVTSCSQLSLAYAEGQINLGNGAFGANRRVETAGRHIGVSGTFSEPDIFIPPVNRSQSKPTYYVGSASGDARVDAGIQYESRTLNGVAPGWSAFIDSTALEWTSPAVGGAPWRANRNSLGNVTLNYQVLRNGGVLLSLSGGANFSFYANPPNNGATPAAAFARDANGQITTAVLNAMRVRRVIGMTQAGNAGDPFDWDGSHSRNNLFSNGDIATVRIVNNAPVLNNDGDQLLLNWQGTWNSVNQPTTGYAPGGQDGQGNWIIDFNFAGMSAPNNAGTHRDQVVDARYSRERVNINLKRAVPLVGEPR